MNEPERYGEVDDDLRSALSFRGAPPACPKCGSNNTQSRDLGRRTGCVFGAFAGVATGVMVAVATADVPAIPAVRVLGIVSVAIMGGMAAGSAGSNTGAALGESVDRNILNNRTCLSCGKHFRIAA
mgnify:CR=1 FL=1